MSVNKLKASATAVVGMLSAWLGVLAIPMGVLIGMNIADYVTGLMAAKYRNQTITSYKGFRGIAKKVCMWLLVGIGAVIDWLLLFAGETVGISISVKFAVASIVAVWLICNEIISVLENIGDIGVPLPPYLLGLVKRMKDEVEFKGTEDTTDDKNST